MNNKRIFVTGGAGGFGRAIALRFAKAGYKVCIGDIKNELGEQTQKELQEFSPDSFYMQCDVTIDHDFIQIRDTIIEKWGGLDVVVNNAGVAGTTGPTEMTKLSDWQWVMDVNLFGVVRGCNTFIPLFKQQGSGHIVNVASAAGFLSAAYMANYNATKAAVISLSETLRHEYESKNIYTTAVCPAFFETDLLQSARGDIASVNEKFGTRMSASSITADDIADDVYQAVSKKSFWVVPHRQEKTLWNLKRFYTRAFSYVMKKIARENSFQ